MSRPLKVLIIESEDSLAFALREQLAKAGDAPRSAATFAEVTELLPWCDVVIVQSAALRDATRDELFTALRASGKAWVTSAAQYWETFLEQ